MDAERWQTIERLFFEALELDGPERTAFLKASCGEDGVLRSELEALLGATGEEARLRIEERLSRFLAARCRR